MTYAEHICCMPLKVEDIKEALRLLGIYFDPPLKTVDKDFKETCATDYASIQRIHWYRE